MNNVFQEPRIARPLQSRNRVAALMKKSRLLGIFLMTYVVIGQAYAQDLRMAVSHWPPWTINESTASPGDISGVDVEIVRAIAELMDLSVTLIPCPWKRCLLMMEQGEIDIATSLQKRPERERYMSYFDQPYKTLIRRAFYLRKGEERNILSYEDLAGKLIGYELGSKQFVRFDQDESLRKYPVPHPIQAFKMLASGRLDAVVMTESVGDYLVVTNGLTTQIGKAPYFHQKRSPAYLAISKKSSLVPRIAEFNDAFAQLVEAGFVEQAKAEYFLRYGLSR